MAKCKYCKKEFEEKPCCKNRFCSYRCYWNSRKGKPGYFIYGKTKLSCNKCGKEYLVWNYQKNKSKYCSRECARGTFFKKKLIPWNKGKKWKQMAGKNNPEWKGDSVGYFALHSWINRNFGKADKCEECGFESDNGALLHWANISGEYKRDISDYKQLCIRCHRKLDNWSQKMWATRKENFGYCLFE